MPRGSYEASDKPLSRILRTEQKRYQIPRYQRNYSWKRSQYETLWNDLLDERKRPVSRGMFLGTILLNLPETDDHRTEVIDGQQRMITLTILLSSIRDAFNDLSDFNNASKLQRNYIANSDLGDEEEIPVLITGAKLQPFFSNHIQHFPRTDDFTLMQAVSEEEKNVERCRKFFDAQIKKQLKEIPDHVQRNAWLVSLSKTITQVILISIEVEFEEDAYAVFESVNAKGMELTLADLLKNLIFRNLRPNEEGEDTAQRQWDQIIENLDGTGFPMKKFIRYYWLSKYDFLTESKLFDAVNQKLKIEKMQTWQQFLDDLVNESARLRRLTHPDSEDYSDLDSPRRISEALQAISLMGVSQVYVLLLAISRNLSLKKKWQGDLEFLENFCFRYNVIGKGQAVRVEKSFSNYAREIEGIRKLEGGARIKKLNSILDKLRNEFSQLARDHVPKELFVEGFNREIQYSTTPKKKNVLGYVLLKLNDHIGGGTGELQVDPRMVNIEHVLPQKPAQWGLDEKEIEDYVHSIGNLTYLSKKLNSEIGNKPIVEKIVKLKESELPMVKKLVKTIEDNQLVWNEKAIDARANDLAVISFEEVWKI
jgi:uncharacterized protein with ParB-like and HNH nuclease domain